MHRKAKGSALLWAVCAMVILTFVVTGILALDKRYATEEIQTIAENQAEYYARSGIVLASDDLCTNSSSLLMPAFGNVQTASYDFDGVTCFVEMDRTREAYEIELTATASVGGSSKTVMGRVAYVGTSWKFTGYITD